MKQTEKNLFESLSRWLKSRSKMLTMKSQASLMIEYAEALDTVIINHKDEPIEDDSPTLDDLFKGIKHGNS